VPLTWDDRKSLYRLTGIAEELLVTVRHADDHVTVEAAASQLRRLFREVQSLLEASDGALADEFSRTIFASDDDGPTSIAVLAATLTGWLRANNAVAMADEERRVSEEAIARDRPRKRTIGFRVRSIVAREPVAESQDAERSPTTF
jgi:hypothetical protein